MSTQTIQKTVLTVLQLAHHPISVRELIAQVRAQNPDFISVSDFDLRSAVLAMTANGTIQSTSTNQVVVSPNPAQAERG
jgi:hypothetical protein